MTAIAQRAGVALDTVYAAVGRKPELARLLIETAISGTSQAIPAEERDYVQAIRAADDAENQDRHLRIGDARPSPAAWRRSCRSSSRPRPPSPNWPRCGARSPSAARRTCACSSADLAAVAPLRVDPDDAADIVWATNAPELYQLLVSQRGWSPERYEHFLADTWRRLLLVG